MNGFLKNNKIKSIALLLKVGSLIALVWIGLQSCTMHDQNLPEELITVKENTWRSATIFTHVRWKDLLFYGGGSGSDGGDPRHEIEIGVFHLTTPNKGNQHPDNPIVTRKQFGLDKPGKGITPLAIYERKDSLFMFCTSRPNDDLQPRIVLISASVKNPFKWGDYKTIIDKNFSGKDNNHGASVIVDPDNPENVLLYFAASDPSEEYRILLATVPIAEISSPKKYGLLNDYSSPVLKREDGKTNYPHIRYDSSTEEYELWYSGNSPDNSSTRSSFKTVSKLKNHFEPALNSVIDPSGITDRNDNVYATGPKVYGNHSYYSGRNKNKGNYLSIFYKPLPLK